jgi:hypothetical protein
MARRGRALPRWNLGKLGKGIPLSGGGGGGGAPEWVPEGSAVHADFIGNRAWAAGAVAPTDVVGSDANAGSVWGANEPAVLTEAGLHLNDATPLAFLGATAAKLLAGATLVLRWRQTPPIAVYMFYVTTGGTVQLQFEMSTFFVNRIKATSSGAYNNTTVSDVLNTTTNGLNIAAFTLTPTRAEIAANGNGPNVGVLDTDDWPVPGFNSVFIVPSMDGIDLESATIYETPVAAADLPALSTL